jgi:hypothetical protein
MRLRDGGRLALSALILATLTACGGGGDSASDSATVTVLAGTTSTPAGSYSSSKKTQEVADTGTALGNATSITFEFTNFEVGVSVINNDPSIYVLGLSDATDDYICVVGKVSAQTGYRACPSGTTVDANAKTAKFTNATLAGLSFPSRTVVVSGQFTWK